MLCKVKDAIPIKSDAYDAELLGLIAAAKGDLGIVGVKTPECDALIERAIITYCRAHFGSPKNYAGLKASYDEQKAQLSMATGYTDWGNADGDG